jgi:hypothetical protein
MRTKILCAAWLAVWLGTLGTLLIAQEGHPLVGSWHGTWGLNDKDRNDVTMVMNFDGENVTGVVNPGLDSSKLQKAVLEPKGWTVHFETDVKDRSGKLVHVVIDGKIQDLTSVHRSIVGSWTQGTQKNDFKIVRDN